MNSKVDHIFQFIVEYDFFSISTGVDQCPEYGTCVKNGYMKKKFQKRLGLMFFSMY